MIVRRAVYAAVSVAYAAGIFMASADPSGTDTGQPRLLLIVLWNLAHVPVYAGLTWCLLMSATGGRWRASLTAIGYAVVTTLAVGYGILDEFHQSQVDGRVASAIDLGLDAAGILTVQLLHRTTSRREGAP